jgi:uncharacterized phage protein gp47/JayE
MADLKIDNTGLTINDLNDVYEYLTTQFKLIYGENINIDQNTPDGQIISIYSKLNADLQAALLQIYNGFDPDSAIGMELNKIIKLSAITRRPATKSTVSVDITTSSPVTLTADYALVDTLGQNWIIQKETALAVGTTSVIFEAVEWGSVSAEANTIIEQGTIFTEVSTVTNPLASSVGIDEETDIELRQRRNKSLEKPSYSTIGGLLASLLEVDNVIDCKIYENDTGAYNVTLDLAPHSIWCIVDGGLNSDIAEAIAKEKTAGTPLKGAMEENYQEVVTKSDGNTFIYTHTAKFDRPVETEIYLTLDVYPKNAGDIIDTDLIKQKLSEKLFRIAEDLTITELYSYAYQAANNFIVTNLQASKDNITYKSDKLETNNNEKFKIITSKITITGA